MKYQLGDTVLIIHSNEEGTIVDFINDKMVIVEVKGVRFPVYMDQIDFPYFQRFSKKKLPLQKKEKQYIDDIRKEKKEKQVPKEEDGVWLTFLPVMDVDEFGDTVVEKMKLHLVNHTKLGYNFTYKLHFFGKPDFTLSNKVSPFEDFYLHDINFEDLNDSPSFDFEFSLLVTDKKKASHFEAAVKLKPKQLFARIEELKQKNLATFSQLLFAAYPDKQVENFVELGKLAQRGYKIYDAKEARQHLEPPRTVVDLHIDKITDDWSRLSNAEILNLQMKTFEKFYQLAVAHGQPELTVIHGIGEGKLRDEIHDRLRTKKDVRTFVNQYHPRYGWGATEIYFS